MVKVEKLMKADVASCRSHDKGSVAARIMWERDCGVVPVVDEDSRVLGMVTDRDLCMASYFQKKPVHEIPVSRVMSQELWSCRAEDDASDAELKMREHQVRRLPVTDAQGRLRGILSLSDIALEAAREARAKPKKLDVSFADVAATLGDISMPRPRLQKAAGIS